jgi:hypothetical protein
MAKATTDVSVDGRASCGPWWKRLGWFALLWALGVMTVGTAAFVLKGVMRLAGLTT